MTVQNYIFFSIYANKQGIKLQSTVCKIKIFEHFVLYFLRERTFCINFAPFCFFWNHNNQNN